MASIHRPNSNESQQMETKKQHKQSQSITFLTPLLISSVSLAIDTRPISSSATIITLSLLMVKQISYCDRQEGREAGGGGGPTPATLSTLCSRSPSFFSRRNRNETNFIHPFNRPIIDNQHILLIDKQ